MRPPRHTNSFPSCAWERPWERSCASTHDTRLRFSPLRTRSQAVLGNARGREAALRRATHDCDFPLCELVPKLCLGTLVGEKLRFDARHTELRFFLRLFQSTTFWTSAFPSTAWERVRGKESLRVCVSPAGNSQHPPLGRPPRHSECANCLSVSLCERPLETLGQHQGARPPVLEAA